MPFQDVGYTAKNDLAEVYKTRFLECFRVTRHRQKLWKGLHWLHPTMSGLPTASTPTTLPQTWNPSSWTTTRHRWGAACDLTVDPVVAGKFWQHSSVHWWISLHLCGHQEGLDGEWIVRKSSVGPYKIKHSPWMVGEGHPGCDGHCQGKRRIGRGAKWMHRDSSKVVTVDGVVGCLV